MSRPTNAEEARIYLDELANFTGFGDYAEPFIEAAKAYALLALADAANNIADAIREQKTEPINLDASSLPIKVIR